MLASSAWRLMPRRASPAAVRSSTRRIAWRGGCGVWAQAGAASVRERRRRKRRPGRAPEEGCARSWRPGEQLCGRTCCQRRPHPSSSLSQRPGWSCASALRVLRSSPWPRPTPPCLVHCPAGEGSELGVGGALVAVAAAAQQLHVPAEGRGGGTRQVGMRVGGPTAATQLAAGDSTSHRCGCPAVHALPPTAAGAPTSASQRPAALVGQRTAPPRAAAAPPPRHRSGSWRPPPPAQSPASCGTSAPAGGARARTACRTAAVGGRAGECTHGV